MTRREIIEQIRLLNQQLEVTPYEETTVDQVEKWLRERGFLPETYNDETYFEKTVSGPSGNKILITVGIDESPFCYTLTDDITGETITDDGFLTLEKLFENLQELPSYGKFELTPTTDPIIVWQPVNKKVNFLDGGDIASYEMVDTVDVVNGKAIR